MTAYYYHQKNERETVSVMLGKNLNTERIIVNRATIISLSLGSVAASHENTCGLSARRG
jgi:hypothetical protein